MSYVFKSFIAATFMSLATVASADKLSLNEISNFLNDLKTASGDFTQINDDGTISVGKIFIKRPGRMRFEYDDALVLASNGSIKIYDKKSNQPPESYALRTHAAFIDLGAQCRTLVRRKWLLATTTMAQPQLCGLKIQRTLNTVALN